MRYEIQQLSVGGILDQAIDLTKNHFWLLLKITLPFVFPLTVLMNLLMVWSTPFIENAALFDRSNPSQVRALVAFFGLMIVFMINWIVAIPLSRAAVIQAITSSYFEQPFRMGAAFRRAGRVYLQFIVTMLLFGIAYTVGLFLCLIPGLIFYVFFMLCMEVVVIEGRWGIEALRRSWVLINGNAGTAIVLLIVVYVISQSMIVCPQIIPQPELSAIMLAVTQVMLFAFSWIVKVVFYFSCRCRLENFDLELLADAVGAEDLVGVQA